MLDINTFISNHNSDHLVDLLRLCPPPSTLCAPQLQSTCHYIVNHYVKYGTWVWGGGGCKQYTSTKVGGGGAQTEKVPFGAILLKYLRRWRWPSTLSSLASGPPLPLGTHYMPVPASLWLLLGGSRK